MYVDKEMKSRELGKYKPALPIRRFKDSDGIDGMGSIMNGKKIVRCNV